MLSIHHIGYIVEDIESASKDFIGLEQLKLVRDKKQNADLALYKSINDNIFIEFIKPFNSNSYTWKYLKDENLSIHHICYSGIDYKTLELKIKEKKYMKIKGPIYASLFDREVCFVLSRNKLLFEFII